MTVIRPNSIAGVTSITAQGDNISFYSSDGVSISQFNVNVNSTSGVSTVANLSVTGIATAFKYETPALTNNHFKSNSTSSGDYVRLYAGGGTAQWDIYGNGENLRMGDNSSSATARVQFDNPTLHRSTATTNGVAALTAKQEVNNGGYLIFDGKNSSDTTVFSVTHNGRINLSENIVFASGQGLDFSAAGNAAGMTSELLDDYEEGTWTPNVSGGGVSWSTQEGRYTKIGNLVVVNFWLQAGGTSSSSGTFSITGLPFALLTVGTRPTGAIRAYQLANFTGKSGVIGWSTNGSTEINPAPIDGNGLTEATNLNHNVWQAGAELHCTFSYQTA